MTETDDSPVASPEIIRRLMLFAVVLSIASTAMAFWLSYEHLHDVASGHGLSGARAWAWPGTVDTFIIIGEVMILVANLLRRTDTWAICVTVIGSVGSVALNVAGVGAHAAIMTYVVAAVPPCGALMSFAILMRQIKKVLTPRREEAAHAGDDADSLAPETAPIGDSPTPAPAASLAPADAPLVASPTPPVGDNASASERQPDAPAVAGASAKPAPAPRQRTPRPVAKKASASRGRSMGEWVEVAGPVFHDEFRRLRRQPTGDEFATAIKKAGLGTVSASTAKNIRAEILDRADVPALDGEGM